MHIKFLKHGKGSTTKTVQYLLGAHDHKGKLRADVRVLRGDPGLVALVGDSSVHQWRYTSGIIAWAPDDQPCEDDIEAVLDDFEQAAFAGLDPGQYTWCVVLHRDDNGGVHTHIIVPRVELTSGKSLNIAPPGHKKIFDALRDSWNWERAWARPDDPDRARLLQPGNEAYRPRIKSQIFELLEYLAAEGEIETAEDVEREIANFGEITRRGRNYISVRPEGAKKTIRMTGEMFRDDWLIEHTVERENRREAERLAGRAGKRDPEAAQRAREMLAAAIERRAAYNRQSYQRPLQSINCNAQRSRAATTEPGREHRTASSGRGNPRREAEPTRGPAQLGEALGHYLGSDAGRSCGDEKWITSIRPTDRQPNRKTGDAEAGNPRFGKRSEATGRIGNSGGQWGAIPSWLGPEPALAGTNERRPASHRTDADEGVSEHDRIGNTVTESTRAAATRLRNISERVVRSAREIADCAEQTTNREPLTTPRTGTQRSGECIRSGAADEARHRLNRTSDRLRQVSTAYEAWLARAWARELQDEKRRAALRAVELLSRPRNSKTLQVSEDWEVPLPPHQGGPEL